MDNHTLLQWLFAIYQFCKPLLMLAFVISMLLLTLVILYLLVAGFMMLLNTLL